MKTFNKHKRRTIVSAIAALCAVTMFCVTTAWAQYEPVNVVDENDDPVTMVGTTLGVTDVWHAPTGTETIILLDSDNEFTVGVRTNRFAVIGTNDETYDNSATPFGNLFITNEYDVNAVGGAGVADQLNGFRYQNNTGLNFEGILSGNSITVFNKVGDAFGAAFLDSTVFYGIDDPRNNAANIEGLINISTITVESTAGGEYGATGLVGGILMDNAGAYIDFIKADSASYATGVELAAIEDAGTLNVSTIEATSGGVYGALGIWIQDEMAGTISSDSITAKSGNDAEEVRGLRISGDYSGYTEIGKITAEGSLWAVGASINGMNPDGIITIDEINATTASTSKLAVAPGVFEGAGADGFVAFGLVDAGTSINLGEVGGITVEASRYATGAQFVAGFDGDLVVGDIKATATNVANEDDGATEANAILISNDSYGTITTTGKLTATADQSDNGRAYGVRIEGTGSDVSLFLQDDITATGTQYAYGIVVDGDASILLESDIAITATGVTNPLGDSAAILTTGDLNIANLGGNLTIEGGIVAGNDLSVYGDGATFNVDSLYVVNDVYLTAEGDGLTMSLNMPNVYIGGTNGEINGNVTIIANGEMTTYGDIATFDGGISDQAKLVNKAIFTGYGIDYLSNTIYSRKLQNANLNSEFLAAGMIHNRYTGYLMVRDKFISGNARYGNGILGQAPCDEVGCDPCGPCGSFAGSGARTAWVNYVGRGDTYADWNLGSDGVQVGSDLYRTKRNQVGVIFGYEGGWANRTDARIDSKDTYGGFYAAHVLRNGADVRFLYNYGQQKFDMDRYNGIDLYRSDFKGRTQEINLELGKRLHDGAWSFRPFVAADFYLNRLNGTKESSTTGLMPLTYDRLNTTQAFLRFGFDTRYQTKRFTLNSGLSYAYDLKDDAYATGVHSGPYYATLRGAKVGRELLMFNVNGDYLLGKYFSVFGGYDAQVVVDRHGGYQHIGYVGGAFKW